MRRHRVTLTELARSLSLSTCTVSRILNRAFDGFTYAPETIRRVEEQASALGYVPNAQARSLRTYRTKLVGFLLPSAQASLFGSLTDHVELELRRRQYLVLAVHSRGQAAEEKTLIRTLLARDIDGLLWIPSRTRVKPEDWGLRTPFPAVILDRPGCTTALPFVATDNRAASRALAQRIRECGHQKIGVLNSSAHDRSMQERLAGISDVYGSRLQLLEGENDPASARQATARLMGSTRHPTALIALSEMLALGAISALRDLDLRIPEDVSFAAFDEFPLASHWSPRITVVRQDISALAKAAADLLVSRIEGTEATPQEIRIPATLEWRESVREQKA